MGKLLITYGKKLFFYFKTQVFNFTKDGRKMTIFVRGLRIDQEIMQQYKKDYLKSRNKTENENIFCEITSCHCLANDIHHCTRSIRGKRKHKKDGSDLIALCRMHHDWIHDFNTQENIEVCLAIVQKIIKRKISKLFTL